MPNLQVFSLADVLGRAEQIKAERLQNQQFIEEQESERALSDILANSIDIQQSPESLQGATPLPPELSGPPQPTAPGVQPQWQPGRTEANLSWDKVFQNLAQADPRIRNQTAMKLQQMRMEDQQMRMEEEKDRLKAERELRGGGSSIAHLKPYKDPKTGKWVYGLPTETGFRAMTTEAGDIAEAPQWDPYDRARSSAQGKEHGSAQGEAQAQLAGYKMDVDELGRLSDELLKHPGRRHAIGTQGIVPGVPGTEQSAFVLRFDQIKAMAFKAAYETLKGGGQITEYESKTAALAINRMERATTQREFESALSDFNRSYRIGLEKIRLKAEGRFGSGRDREAPKPQTGQGTVKTWEDAQYQYRRLPDGTVQRKKK